MKSIKKAASRISLRCGAQNDRNGENFGEPEILKAFAAIALQLEDHNRLRKQPIKAQIIIGCDGITNAHATAIEAMTKTVFYYSNDADVIRALSDANRAAYLARALNGLPLSWLSPNLFDNHGSYAATSLINNATNADIIYSSSSLIVYLADWRFLFVTELKRALGQYTDTFTYYFEADREDQIKAFWSQNHFLRRAVSCIRQYRIQKIGRLPVAYGDIGNRWYTLYPEAKVQGAGLTMEHARRVNLLYEKLYPNEGKAIYLPTVNV